MSEDLDDFRNMRMPVFSWDYEDLSRADLWFLMARAYYDCSFFLLTEMAQEGFDRNYHRALVAVSLFTHSIELFLKAAISQSGNKITANHDLEQLYNRYRKIYPGNKFEFEGEIISVISFNQIIPQNEFARYPLDHAGQPWPGNYNIDIAVWYERLKVFKKDFARLEQNIKERKQNPGR